MIVLVQRGEIYRLIKIRWKPYPNACRCKANDFQCMEDMEITIFFPKGNILKKKMKRSDTNKDQQDLFRLEKGRNFIKFKYMDFVN